MSRLDHQGGSSPQVQQWCAPCFKTKISFVILVITLSLYGCTRVELEATETLLTQPPIGLETETTDAEATPTSTHVPASATLAAPIETLQASTDPAPAAPITPTKVAEENPLEGLLYANPDGTWMHQPDGTPVLITSLRNTTISPDGKYALLGEQGDIWIVDVMTGDRRNITNTPEEEFLPQWWESHPDIVLFLTQPATLEPAPGVSGYLSWTSVTDGGAVILDESIQAGLYAPSPDGRFIAYGLGPTARLYDWENEEILEVEPEAFGFESLKGGTIGSPAWCEETSGLQMVWVWGGTLNSGDTFGLLMLDPDTGSQKFFLPHQLLGMGGWPEPPVCSPTGAYLAYFSLDSNDSRRGLWIVENGSGESIYLGDYFSPTWHPSGGFLGAIQDSQVYLFRTGEWTPIPVQDISAFSLNWMIGQ